MQNFLNKIICGDCIEILKNIDKPFADLIFADPPFNIGYKYDKYYDKVKSKNYIAWTKEWIQACRKVLKPDGSFYIAIGDDYAANVKIIADEVGLFMRNWIIWHYTFGQQTKNKFALSHTHIFYFVKDRKNFTFNDYAVRVPSDRQLIYNDKRANPAGKMPDDVWMQFPRVCGTFKERARWHPCQMPENLLKKIIAVSSDPGDCVLDPFSGSGTTPAAAYQLGRNYMGIDISRDYVENASKRLDKLKRQSRKIKVFDYTELSELKRLVCDMRVSADAIIKNEKLMNILVSQFSIRMNNKKKYSVNQISEALKGISD
ncbi:MAG: DNA-methyltransferase [Planctomycetota bacterium]|jgi:site-specific DNA-methyltransferase (adenine-specific)